MSLKSEEMSVVDHLTELRKRIIYVLIVFVLGLIGGLFCAKPIYDYLISTDLAQGFVLHAFSFWDGIGMYMKIAMVVSLVISVPFIAYQLWAFISPARYRRSEVRHFVMFPMCLFFSLSVFLLLIILFFQWHFRSRSQLPEAWDWKRPTGLHSILTSCSAWHCRFALLFELPLLVMFLTKLRVLNPLRLRKMRRYAYFTLVFIAVVITPPDFISDFLVTIPLLILYEFSVFLSAFVYRKQLAADAARDERYVQKQE